jgi:hypothetical protein
MIEAFNGPPLDMSCERRETSIVPTQAFTLFNGQFVHDMALALAAKLEKLPEKAQIRTAFQRVLGRAPEAPEEKAAAVSLVKLRALHNANPVMPAPAPQPVVHTITSELTGEQHRFVHPEDPSAYEHNLHPSQTRASVRALADVILALLNSNEFSYVY